MSVVQPPFVTNTLADVRSRILAQPLVVRGATNQQYQSLPTTKFLTIHPEFSNLALVEQ